MDPRHSAIDQWLALQTDFGRAANTIKAYSHSLRDYQRFCTHQNIPLETASREHVARYVRNLLDRPIAADRTGEGTSQAGLARATIRQRLTAVRLFYEYLIEEGLRTTNPVGRGSRLGHRSRQGAKAMVPAHHTLPWIPGDEDWQRLLVEARTLSLRNRLMLALAYDAGLRREELCRLNTGDIDPARRFLQIRAETTKGNRGRVVPYSACTGQLLHHYLAQRRGLTTSRGPLFISESPRTKGQPITLWTWSKVIRGLGDAVSLPRFSTHTLRHLCLTDLARSGWELHEIATFAGHRNTATTLIYIHLSGRDLAAKLASASSVHEARLAHITESWR